MVSAVQDRISVAGNFAEIRDVESRARRFETPCGDGHIVWRQWGEGRPVLMLHGGSGSWLHWLRLTNENTVKKQSASMWKRPQAHFLLADAP